MSILIGILGIMVFLGIAFLMSNKKKEINFKAVGILFGLQLVATVFMLKTTVGMKIIEGISNGVAKVMGYAGDGIEFVFGGLMFQDGASVFFINVLLIMVFTSTVLSILTYIGVLPLGIKYVGGLLSKITGLPKVETFTAVSSMFFGQSESLLAIKGQFPKLTNNRMFIVSTSAMASVSASIIGSYMTMLEPKYILIAMVLNMFNGLIIASIVSPVGKDFQDDDVDTKELQKSSGDSLFDAISNGALDGGKVALIIGAMLIAFIGLIAMFNGMFDAIFGLTLQEILGYIFAPFAFLMGVPAADVLNVGNLMGTKLVANEFVAMLDLVNIKGEMTAKGLGIVTVFLTSFAAIGSIGMISGTVQAVSGAKGKVVAKFGLKLLFTATIVSLMSATIVGLFI
ncbi:NupC/NupG family nucleoside CNT transporter [Bacillus haynesii]|uniref:NupC/NupG family nucleoside CNT transporter n=1 Tax=Bacillus haynesii TaxID=1925021 RepID=UPI002281B4DD|nr:nucleoside transporter C-terminal domain-containing protein [Bacillus haynesii]MCY8048415.1 NupC/NupG family nucleoside CNT transporter [Bacillus haynesii]MCY9324030.1 NupC/NupG family nucleoside CNT transporter [Bacillus haynesii]